MSAHGVCDAETERVKHQYVYPLLSQIIAAVFNQDEFVCFCNSKSLLCHFNNCIALSVCDITLIVE